MLPPKIAFVHDWLVTFGGGEQVLAALLEVWPDAPVFTLVHDPDGPCGFFTRPREVYESFIGRLPGSRRNHRIFLPLMPLAIEQFDLSEFDIVISASHAVAKGALTTAHQLHLCYIFTPVRYAWDLYHRYLKDTHSEGGLRSLLIRPVLHYIRNWDILSANRVDDFIAISNFTARRVEKIYRRRAEVIYPPVDIQAFTPSPAKEDYYLTVSRLVPYKRIDLIIEAFNQMKTERLVIIGEGPERKRLEALAGPNIQFLGYQSTEAICRFMQQARAFVFAALEDFGIVPVEAQACGTPVIAYGQGGACETVIDGVTGVLFPEQTAESLIEAVKRLEALSPQLEPTAIRKNAERFSKDRFQQEFRQMVEQKWLDFSGKTA